MKKVILFIAMSMSMSAFATIYDCGSPKDDQGNVSKDTYQVDVDDSYQVFLIDQAVSTKMTMWYQDVDVVAYTNGNGSHVYFSKGLVELRIGNSLAICH